MLAGGRVRHRLRHLPGRGRRRRGRDLLRRHHRRRAGRPAAAGGRLDPAAQGPGPRGVRDLADMHMGLQALFKLDDAKAIAACICSRRPRTACSRSSRSSRTWTPYSRRGRGLIEEPALKLVMNRAKNYGAIWKDPADPEFRQLPSVTPESAPCRRSPASRSPTRSPVSPSRSPRRAHSTEALLHALERYQGAQAAGDQEWALVQARAVRDLSTALDQHLGSTTAVADLRAPWPPTSTTSRPTRPTVAAVINRIRTAGLHPGRAPAARQPRPDRGADRRAEDGFVPRARRTPRGRRRSSPTSTPRSPRSTGMRTRSPAPPRAGTPWSSASRSASTSSTPRPTPVARTAPRTAAR